MHARAVKQLRASALPVVTVRRRVVSVAEEEEKDGVCVCLHIYLTVLE